MWEAQQQRGALSLTERALVNIRFGLVTTQKSRRQLGEGSLPRSLNSTQERAASLGGRRAELSVPRETSVPAGTSPTALTPRPDTVPSTACLLPFSGVASFPNPAGHRMTTEPRTGHWPAMNEGTTV